MWKRLLLAPALLAAAFAQTGPSPVEFANLREDVRGLTQRVGSLMLRIEQLERENAELRQRASATDKSYVTLVELNHAISEVNLNLRNAIASAKTETLQHVAAQIEKLAKQTNAALDSLAKAQTARPAVQTSFSDDFPKEGIRYTVEKGDTLASIAKKTGAKTQDIINANKLSDPSRIMAGDTLIIPKAK